MELYIKKKTSLGQISSQNQKNENCVFLREKSNLFLTNTNFQKTLIDGLES